VVTSNWNPPPTQFAASVTGTSSAAQTSTRSGVGEQFERGNEVGNRQRVAAEPDPGPRTHVQRNGLWSGTDCARDGFVIELATIKTQHIGAAGELLVQYQSLKYGIDSARLTTDSGIDLMMDVPGTEGRKRISVRRCVRSRARHEQAWTIRRDFLPIKTL
jgi:hypothetical protein